MAGPVKHLIPFKPGQSGNPKGRPKGARHLLGEQFLRDLHEGWKVGGKVAIAEAFRTDPVAVCAMVAKLLPREHTLEVSETLASALRRLAGQPDTPLPGEPADLRDGGVAGHA